MSKKFNNTAILTTKNPEAFLNFTYDACEYWIIPTANIADKILYVNGLDISTYSANPSLGYALLLNTSDNIASFHIYANVNYNFDTNLTFHLYDSDTLVTEVSTHDISILNRPYIVSSNIINTYNNDDFLVEDEASYLLMRTTPKFTGNIVINVDTSNNIFLDTFKVSDILSNKLYRRQKVSGNSVLSNDIRNVFYSLPLGELYRLDKDNPLSIATPKTEYKDQFNTTYNYGARLLKDELYIEDYGVLAPLWLNSKLPDYFAVFRLSNAYNSETYDSSSLSTLAETFLTDSSLIKSWSMKSDAPLGKYLFTHLTDVIKKPASVFLSLTNPGAIEYDPNIWYGMSVKSGVLIESTENPYFFNSKTNNFTKLNAFISDGFQRGNILCPNLLNLQYVFSDEDASLYTMNRYFGLYLTENVLYNVAYYSDVSGGSVSILSLDGKDSSVFFNSSIFDVNGDIIDSYKNRIFVLGDGTNIQRFTNVNFINGTQKNSFISKPYKNIFSTDVEISNINPFITLTLNEKLTQGEHLRIVNKTQNKIWEIYSIDASTYDCDKYCTVSINSSGNYPTVYRTYFDISGEISDQVQEIEDAFDLFAEFEDVEFRSGLHGDNWVSLILNDNADSSEEWFFQRITGSTLNNFNDPSSGFSYGAEPEDITFFGRFTPNISNFEIISYDASYGPIDFELYGNRRSIMLEFLNRGTNNLYSLDSSQNIIDKFEDITLYQGTDFWYKKILDIDVSDNSYLYVKDPLSIEDKILIMTGYEIKTINNKLNAYSIYPLNISLMGINPVKDIDFTVYDSSLGYTSDYWYNREDDVSTYYIFIPESTSYTVSLPNSYVIESGTGTLSQNGLTRDYSTNTLFNTFDTSVYLSATSATLVTYAILNGTQTYKSYSYTASVSTGIKEENVYDFYESSTLLKYGLTVPAVSKWVGRGTDCRNNPILLRLDTSLLDVSTNFVPTSDHFSQEITYPVFKYLTSGNKAWKSYVFYDINDVIYDSDSSVYLTFKEAMFEHPYVDYFSKLVYSNYNVDSTYSRSSEVYYNKYKNSIDTLITGLNLSIKIQNVAKSFMNLRDYDRYRFSIISTSSKNKDARHPIEIIINENTKTILIVWYQGNDELNYNRRYSTYLPGKALLDTSNYGFVTNSDDYYSFIKTPYFVNNSTVNKTLQYLYSTPITLGSISKYAQFNKNLNGFNSAWNAFSNNTIQNSTFLSSLSYNTFSQYVNYSYTTSNNTYGNYVTNYGYQYNSDTNNYTNNTTHIDTLSYLLSTSYSYVMCYIIRGEGIYSNYDFGSCPVSVTINSPRTYKNSVTYNGWFNPKFNSILEFNFNEDSSIISIVEKDFTLSNTNLRSYNFIPQLWYNKLTDQVTISDISTGNAISYISNYNVFKSQWDKNYYIKDGNYINGYECTFELPSFFGSKLIKLPDQLILDTWSSTNATSSETSSEITLSFNLTRVIIDKFKSNLTFTKNWGSFGSDTLSDSYVKETIMTYYNLSVPKIKLDFYIKSYNTQRLFYTYDSVFSLNEKQNFNGQLLYENEEYIYRAIIPKLGNYSYYVKFTLTEK